MKISRNLKRESQKNENYEEIVSDLVKKKNSNQQNKIK
jgi:hypothetical protein